MNKINDGGPAFPVPAVYDHAREQVNSAAAYGADAGMSLRDYFATHAPPPPAWWDRYRESFNELHQEADHTATWNYAYADAMLKVRGT